MADKLFTQSTAGLVELLAPVFEPLSGAGANQPICEVRPVGAVRAQAGPGATRKALAEIVEALHPFVETTAWMLPHEVLHGLLQFILLVRQPLRRKLPNPFAALGEKLATGDHAGSNDFGRGAGCGGAEISHEIADREVNFVTDGGNHGQL